MRILFCSDNPHQNSGYSVLARPLVKALVAWGHEVYYLGLSYYGMKQEIDGYTLVPNINHGDRFGGKSILHYQELYKPDCVITNKDPYVWQADVLSKIKNWYPVFPVDTEPVSAAVSSRLQFAKRPIVWTKHAQKELLNHGVNPIVAPCYVDTSVYYPRSKSKSREKLGIAQNEFLVLFVGANQVNPPRKSIDKILMAWQRWQREHKHGGVLYMHTWSGSERGGIDIDYMINLLALNDSVRITPKADYINSFSEDELATLYSAADVLINPSTGGGFELTQVEAQACGTPVISTAFTAMRETTLAGWQIRADENEDDLEWSGFGAFRINVRVSKILEALAKAYESRNNAEIRQLAATRTLMYSQDYILENYWKPAMRQIEAEIKGIVTHERELLYAG